MRQVRFFHVMGKCCLVFVFVNALAASSVSVGIDWIEVPKVEKKERRPASGPVVPDSVMRQMSTRAKADADAAAARRSKRNEWSVENLVQSGLLGGAAGIIAVAVFAAIVKAIKKPKKKPPNIGRRLDL